MTEMLEVVDQAGKILRKESRVKIHEQGLMHREVHVWLYTPDGELIFQHRAKDKDTYPDMLDASVGGHVEIGDDWQTAAIKELEEESGLNVRSDELHYIDQVHSDTHDETTGMHNNALRRIYALPYVGRLEDLRIEEGKSQGFEAWPFMTLFNISDRDRKRFIPMVFNDQHLAIMKKVESLYKSDIS